MADQKISQLLTITGANMADNDKFVLVDTSGDVTVATTRAEFFKATPAIDVTGTVTSDGLTVAGDGTISGNITANTAGAGDKGLLVGPTGFSGSFVYKSSGDVEIAPRSGKNLIFANSTGGTEFARIKTNGNFGIGTTAPATALDVDGTITVSGAINFPDASSAGTSTSNSLDFYEEGTWTPVIADAAGGGNLGSATVSSSFYTKIGRQVTVTCSLVNIVTTGMTAGSPLHIRGLPFVSSISNNSVGVALPAAVAFQSSNTSMISIIGGNDYWVVFQTYKSLTSPTFVDIGDLTSGASDIHFTITYITA